MTIYLLVYRMNQALEELKSVALWLRLGLIGLLFILAFAV